VKREAKNVKATDIFISPKMFGSSVFEIHTSIFFFLYYRKISIAKIVELIAKTLNAYACNNYLLAFEIAIAHSELIRMF
jgi:hypothetical protein